MKLRFIPYRRCRGFNDVFYFRIQACNYVGFMLTIFGCGFSLDLKWKKQEHEK